jgi:hypothetical protein
MTNRTAFDASPTTLLNSLSGEIVAARMAHPDVLHVEMRDVHGGRWRFATQDAEFNPSDPEQLVGARVSSVKIDPLTMELCFSFGEDPVLLVKPAPAAAEDDPSTWELITPDGLALEFGPGLRWQITPANTPVARA